MRKILLSVFRYDISDYGIEIILFGFRIRRIPFTNIEDIFLGSKSWGGEIWTVFKVWGLVSIKKKNGLLRYVVIAPEDPENFVLKVKRKIQKT